MASKDVLSRRGLGLERVLPGRPVAPGFGRGPLFVLPGDVGDGESNPAQVRPAIMDAPTGAVIASLDLTPAECVALAERRPAGIALSRGSATGHVAVMAQERAWPLVIGFDGALAGEAGEALLDAVKGRLVLRPTDESSAAFERDQRSWASQRARDAALLPRPATTRDGQTIRLPLVVDQLAHLRAVDPRHADGVGLVRTEMLFMNRPALPGEEGQLATYRILLQWAEGRPVAIRIFDPGEGKALPDIGADGLRGVAFGLAHPELLATQLRALLRASVYGDLTILLPMVETPDQVAAVRDALSEASAALRRAGRSFGEPRIAAMVETSGALGGVADLPVDAYAVGLGDLAAALGEPRQTGPAAPSPALLAAVRRVVAHGAASNRPVTLCGTLAGDPALAETWLRLGVRGLCVPAPALAHMKAAIAGLELGPGGPA